MKKLQSFEISTIRYVHHHGRVCLGEITGEADALLAETMARLAKWKFLMVEAVDDGPAYTCAPAGILIAEQFND
jgi:hypothetical protein